MTSIDRGHVLGAAAFLVPAAAALAPRGGSVILALAAVALLACSPANVMRIRELPRPITLAVAALVAWAVISLIWSVDFAVSLRKVVAFAATVFGGLVLAAAARDLNEKEWKFFSTALVAGMVLGLAVMVEEMTTVGGLYRLLKYGQLTEENRILSFPYPYNFLNRGISVFALISWPAALALWAKGRKRGAALLWLAVFAVVLWSDGDAAAFGILCGLAAFCITFLAPNRVMAAAAAVIVIATLGAPALTRALPDPATASANYPFLPSSAVVRLQIWNYAVDKIAERPILGWGFEMSRSFSSAADARRTVPLLDQDGVAYLGVAEPMPLHPHNAVLQWWVELGGVGAALMAAILFLLSLRARRRNHPPVAKAAAMAMMVGGLGTAAVSYGAWQNWWVSFHLLAVAFLVAVLARTPER